MKLLLTSSGNSNKSIENALIDLLGRPFASANLVFIPTAANLEEDTSEWLEDDINNFKKLEFNSFEVIDIASVKEEIWKPIFEKADILVFGGGNEKYLLEWVRKVRLDTLLKSYLSSKIYVGISAGSMITARDLSLKESGMLYYEDFDRESHMLGLGYVDFEIRPHLNSEHFSKVRVEVLEDLASKNPHKIYAIDDNTAIKVVDDNIEVVSEGQWEEFNQ